MKAVNTFFARVAAAGVSALALWYSAAAVGQGTANAAPAIASRQEPGVPTQAALKEWRSMMSRLPAPPGCHTATYPDTTWLQVPCTSPPAVLYRPQIGGHGTFSVGNGTDDSAEVSSGSISSTKGSFYGVSGVTSETQGVGGSANYFSFQINTNLFSTSKCGTSNPTSGTCQGWLQFVFGNPNTSNHSESEVVIEYWLIDYISSNTPTCPTGWSGDGSGDCTNFSSATGVPLQTISDLSELPLTGQSVSGGSDTVSVSVGSTIYSASVADSVIDLAGVWTESEFNVFGDGNGSQATFNTGSTLVVNIATDNGKPSPPSIVNYSDTGETNNLSLLAPPARCVSGGASPEIFFTESNASGATVTCPPIGAEMELIYNLLLQ
jgi:hypothetical protein